MQQGSGRLSEVGGFPPGYPVFLPPCKTHAVKKVSAFCTYNQSKIVFKLLTAFFKACFQFKLSTLTQYSTVAAISQDLTV